MKNLFLSIMLLLGVSAYAQPQKIFHNDKIYYFQTSNPLSSFYSYFIKVIYIYKSDSNSFYFNRRINPDESPNRNRYLECLDYNDTLFVGDREINKQDGGFSFFNYKGDTININFSDSAYIFYRDTLLQFLVMGQVSDISYQPIIDNTYDTVYTIKLTAYNLDETPMNHYINNLKIKVAVNYGAIEFFDLFRFPNGNTAKYSLNGLLWKDLSRKIGITANRYPYEDVNYNVGDEIHYNSWGGFQGVFDRKFIYRVINKERIESKTIYTFLKTCYDVDASRYGVFTKLTSDTTYFTIDTTAFFNTVFNKLVEPFELVYNVDSTGSKKNNANFGNYLKPTYYTFLDTVLCRSLNNANLDIYRSHINFDEDSNGCYYIYPFSNDNKGGIQRFYGIHIDMVSTTYSHNKIVYLKLGGKEYGTPYINLSLSEPLQENKVTLYPNPFNNTLNIKTESINDVVFELYNKYYQKVHETEFYDGHSIDLSHLNAGVYFYKIINPKSGTMLKSGKLVKE